MLTTDPIETRNFFSKSAIGRLLENGTIKLFNDPTLGVYDRSNTSSWYNVTPPISPIAMGMDRDTEPGIRQTISSIAEKCVGSFCPTKKKTDGGKKRSKKNKKRYTKKHKFKK
jgi:hypothetical protein